MTDSDPVFAANLEFYRAFMQSWEGILANPDAPRVACFDEQVFL